MKESLAARQAALLRQNAELDQKVEAIEQRRQQQLHAARSTGGGSSANLTKRNEISVVELSTVLSDGENRSLNSDISDTMSSPERAASPASRLGLKMDLSASIEATQEDTETIESKSDAKSTRPTVVRTKSQLRRDKSLQSVTTTTSESARKPLRRHKTGLTSDGSAVLEIKPTESSPDAKPMDAVDDGLGLEATVRYQKARLRVLQDDLDVAKSDLKQMQTTNQQLTTRIEELGEENTALKKKQQQTQQVLEMQQELSTAQESKQKILETQLSAAQAKMEELQKAEKQASQQFRSKDVRLNRALEELEKVKAQLQEERRVQGDQTVPKTEYEQLVKENKRLEKQKNELLLAFKKQMKLIDLLKRQRIHMEAAKMLSFTEEEFSKTLELG